MNPIPGVSSYIGLEVNPEHRSMSLWVKGKHDVMSTDMARTLARYLLEQADVCDTEANRKRRVLDELNTPKLTEVVTEERKVMDPDPAA